MLLVGFSKASPKCAQRSCEETSWSWLMALTNGSLSKAPLWKQDAENEYEKNPVPCSIHLPCIKVNLATITWLTNLIHLVFRGTQGDLNSFKFFLPLASVYIFISDFSNPLNFWCLRYSCAFRLNFSNPMPCCMCVFFLQCC